MGDYRVTYVGDSVVGPKTFYIVNYLRLGKTHKDTLEQFQLSPNVQINPEKGVSPSPDTRHYFNRDIYTHITSVPMTCRAI